MSQTLQLNEYFGFLFFTSTILILNSLLGESGDDMTIPACVGLGGDMHSKWSVSLLDSVGDDMTVGLGGDIHSEVQ